MSQREPTLPAATPRFDTIDLMRGYSILAVVLLHTWLRLYIAGYDLRRPELPRLVAHLFFLNGGNGVTVFFAISGFLITLTSLRRFGSLSRMRVSTFYRIRFARIAPLLIFIVSILTGLALMHAQGFQFSPRRAPLWRAILAVFTFHSNWLEARYGFLPPNWNVMWSLSVEEMFYLFFPLACVTFLRVRRGMIFFVVLLLNFVALGPFARTMWSTNEIWLEQSYLGGMDCIALGCLTALAVDHLQRHRRRYKLAANRPFLIVIQVIGWAIVGLTVVGPSWFWKILPTRPDFYGTLLAVAACLIMFASVLRQTEGSIERPSRFTVPVRWYGKHSYEIYLTHEFVVVWGVLLLTHFHPNTNPGPNGLAQHQLGLLYMVAWIVGILALTAPLGWFTARFISEPMNRRLRGAKPPRENTASVEHTVYVHTLD
jgi:peptidoglycan/LPS O-acetylase OafA/YrhL